MQLEQAAAFLIEAVRVRLRAMEIDDQRPLAPVHARLRREVEAREALHAVLIERQHAPVGTGGLRGHRCDGLDRRSAGRVAEQGRGSRLPARAAEGGEKREGGEESRGETFAAVVRGFRARDSRALRVR